MADAHFVELHVSVVGRHVERPHELLDPETGCVGRRDEAGDPPTVALLAGRAGEDVVVGGVVQPGVPVLLARDHPLVAVTNRGGLHPRGVRTVERLGQPEPDARRAVEHLRDPLGLLRFGAVLLHHQDRDEVADDRALVLQVVVQPEAFPCEMLTDDRHLEVAGIVATEAFGKLVSIETGLVGGHVASDGAALPTRRSGRPSRSQSVRASSRR